MILCGGGLKKTKKKRAKNKWNEIDSSGNWSALNLVVVLGYEMDVLHTHRWQNRDVAFFLMDSALLKKKSGAAILRKTSFVFDFVGARRRQVFYCTHKGISPPLLREWINVRIRALPGISRTKRQ